jgi:hypothetical protein
LKEIHHTAWAVRDASLSCDVIHINNVFGLAHSHFVDTPFVYTVHHPHDVDLSRFYTHYSDAHYVAISEFQRRQERMPQLRTIHHGIDLSKYRLREISEFPRPHGAYERHAPRNRDCQESRHPT